MSRGDLVASDLTFSYPRREPVLRSLNAVFREGAVTAVTGASGKGKSTLLYLLGLMLTPSGGQVMIGEKPLSALSDKMRAHLRAHYFGFVFQDAVLDASRTVIDNVVETGLYRGSARNSDIARAADLLAQFRVEVPAEARPGQVSGGQAQRISLCRALLNDPSILLADEPTGNLDKDTARIVIDAMREHARRGNVVVVVTHSEELSIFCDERIELR